MISVSEAKSIIAESVKQLSPVTIPLAEASGLVLAEDVIAPQDIPAYPQSSMDGYAIAFNERSKELEIKGESAAGNKNELVLQEGSATRIFTGAAVPTGADTVVMQEKIKLVNDKLIIEDENLTKGVNVRLPGSEIKGGDLALGEGSILTPAASGFLAGIGITEVRVRPKPKVGIILTGDELKSPGTPLQYGEVFESNSFALTAALKQIQINVSYLQHVKDDASALKNTIEEALQKCDVVLLTGGVSVGEYDFVTSVLTGCRVSTLFHKIKQRPGKPLLLGKKDNKIVFGLPGNPSSVLTCFYEYVVPAIGLLFNKHLSLSILNVPAKGSFSKKVKFTQFLKGYFDGKSATVLPSQESYKMNSFAKANCFIVMPEEMDQIKEGDIVEIHLFS